MSANLRRGQVCLTRLASSDKRKAWDFIKAQRPDLAALLAPESELMRMARATQGQIWVPIEDTGLDPANLATGAS